VPELLLSGAAGGLIVYFLTTLTGWAVRTRQRGRELQGLARVLWPEMKRNSQTIGVLRAAGFDQRTYRSEHPTLDAWHEVRVRLSQLLPEDDFAVLAKFYDTLEMLEAAVTLNDPLIWQHLEPAQDHKRSAMQVVEGYCNAQWRPFKGHTPGPLEEDSEEERTPEPRSNG